MVIIAGAHIGLAETDTRRISRMKLTRLKRLAPVVLEEIKKIEIKKFQPQTLTGPAQSLENHSLCRFTGQAREACQRWSGESKPTFQQDVSPVIDLFMIALAELIKERVISETYFNWQM